MGRKAGRKDYDASRGAPQGREPRSIQARTDLRRAGADPLRDALKGQTTGAPAARQAAALAYGSCRCLPVLPCRM